MASCSGVGIKSMLGAPEKIKPQRTRRTQRYRRGGLMLPLRSLCVLCVLCVGLGLLSRQAQDTVADDIALDVLRARRDRRREGDQVVAHPARGARVALRYARATALGVPGEDLGAEDLHRQCKDALLQLGEEEADERDLGARHARA